MKRLSLILAFIFAIIIIFVLFFALPQHQSLQENEERIRIRKEEMARTNPALLATIEEQIAILEEKAMDDPADSQSWFELGTNKKIIGDYNGAKVALKKAAELDKVSINALHNLGILYQDIGEYEKAEEAFRSIVRRHPNLPDGYMRLAELYRPGVYKNSSEEEKILLEGLGVMQDDQLLLLTLAEYYERAELYEQAIATYTKLLSLNVTNREIIEVEIARLEAKKEQGS